MQLYIYSMILPFFACRSVTQDRWGHRRRKCHVCGLPGKMANLRRHYERQHPDYDAKDALEEDSLTLPLEPEFKAQKGGWPRKRIDRSEES